MLISNVPLMLALFIIVVSLFVLFFKSVSKDAKEEREYYESLSEREKREYAIKYNKEQQAKHSSVAANDISGSRKFL